MTNTTEYQVVGSEVFDERGISLYRFSTRAIANEVCEVINTSIKSAIEKAHKEGMEFGWNEGREHERKAQSADTKRLVIQGFVDAILHGDFEHRSWLQSAGEAYITGKAIPKCPCQATQDKDEKIRRLQALLDAVYSDPIERG